MYEYERPIKLIANRMATEISKCIDQDIWKAVQRVGVDVDKEELIRALNYDRGQYEKGYADAMKNAVPLDKLCEWLAEHYGSPCQLAEIDCYPQCEPDENGECYGMRTDDKKCWHDYLTKWMEGLDDHR